MKKINALIVDDEPAQQDIMLRVLARRPGISVCAVASNTDEALSLLNSHKVDLIFLDVDLGTSTGFDLLQQTEKRNFGVIFCTSHSEFAIRAFRFSAIDYLMKPIVEEELDKAIEKFQTFRDFYKEKNTSLENLISNLSLPPKEHKLALPTSTGLLFMKSADVVQVVAAPKFTLFITTEGNQVVVSRSMKECEEILSSKGFCRIHQSHLINLQHVNRYIKGDGGVVEMSDGSTIEVSRRKKDELLSMLERL